MNEGTFFFWPWHCLGNLATVCLLRKGSWQGKRAIAYSSQEGHHFHPYFPSKRVKKQGFRPKFKNRQVSTHYCHLYHCLNRVWLVRFNLVLTSFLDCLWNMDRKLSFLIRVLSKACYEPAFWNLGFTYVEDIPLIDITFLLWNEMAAMLEGRTMKWQPCWRSIIIPWECSSFVIEKYFTVSAITPGSHVCANVL